MVTTVFASDPRSPGPTRTAPASKATGPDPFGSRAVTPRVLASRAGAAPPPPASSPVAAQVGWALATSRNPRRRIQAATGDYPLDPAVLDALANDPDPRVRSAAATTRGEPVPITVARRPAGSVAAGRRGPR